MEQDHILKVKDVHKSYHKHVVLKGVDFEIKQGEVLGLIGSSGSGKTTLLHTLIGFLKPNKGSVEILMDPPHRALGNPTYKNIYKHINEAKSIYGFASQIPSFYDNLTVKENMEYFGSLYSMSKKIIKTNAELLLHLMDLEGAKDLLAKNLSGGMERRLDIACALMHDPALLILDEPTADLDPVLRSHIYNLIRKINSKNTTIMLASHHLSDIELLCDRIAILHDGKILAVGTPDQIKEKFSKTDHVRLKIKGKQERLVTELEKKSSLHNIQFVNDMITATTNTPQAALKDILSLIPRDKIELLQVSKASLDDIFIHLIKGGEEE